MTETIFRFLLIKTYWMVVWNSVTGDFTWSKTYGWKEEFAQSYFEKKHEGFKVIHIGEGDVPPRTYRSLPFTKA